MTYRWIWKMCDCMKGFSRVCLSDVSFVLIWINSHSHAFVCQVLSLCYRQGLELSVLISLKYRWIWKPILIVCFPCVFLPGTLSCQQLHNLQRTNFCYLAVCLISFRFLCDCFFTFQMCIQTFIFISKSNSYQIYLNLISDLKNHVISKSIRYSKSFTWILFQGQFW